MGQVTSPHDSKLPSAPHLAQSGPFPHVHPTSCCLPNSSNVSLSLTKRVAHESSLPRPQPSWFPVCYACASCQPSVRFSEDALPCDVHHSTPPVIPTLLALQSLLPPSVSILFLTTFKNKLLNTEFAILLTQNSAWP